MDDGEARGVGVKGDVQGKNMALDLALGPELDPDLAWTGIGVVVAAAAAAVEVLERIQAG